MNDADTHGGGASDSALVDESLDESLIDAMLALSPEERLRQNDRMVRTILLLQQGWQAAKAGQDDGGR